MTRAFGWPDRLAVLKWRSKTCPDLVTDGERKRLWFWRRVWRWLLPYKVVVRWWQPVKQPSYVVLRGETPAPGSFADVTAEDDNDTDMQFVDTSVVPLACFLVPETE